MNINELIEFCRAKAIDQVFYPDADSVYRSLCREYSKTFHTPLMAVYELDPVHVVLCVFEERYDGYDLEDEDHVTKMLETLNIIADPDYSAADEEDLEDFMDEALEEEEERVEKGISLTRALAKKKKPEAPKEKAPDPKELPKSGGINLSYLNESENEG